MDPITDLVLAGEGGAWLWGLAESAMGIGAAAAPHVAEGALAGAAFEAGERGTKRLFKAAFDGKKRKKLNDNMSSKRQRVGDASKETAVERQSDFSRKRKPKRRKRKSPSDFRRKAKRKALTTSYQARLSNAKKFTDKLSHTIKKRKMKSAFRKLNIHRRLQKSQERGARLSEWGRRLRDRRRAASTGKPRTPTREERDEQLRLKERDLEDAFVAAKTERLYERWVRQGKPFRKFSEWVNRGSSNRVFGSGPRDARRPTSRARTAQRERANRSSKTTTSSTTTSTPCCEPQFKKSGNLGSNCEATLKRISSVIAQYHIAKAS